MAPGTRPGRDRETGLVENYGGNFEVENIMDNLPAPVDPWNAPGDDLEVAEAVLQEGFEDSFSPDFKSVNDSPKDDENKYESNTEYLNYLESKLKRMESKRKKAEKVTSHDVLTSLKDIKEKQMDWNFRYGVSSSEDETVDSDSSGNAGRSLTNDLRRRMFPEQHALNETELLHLLEHDVIGKIFHQLDINQQK